MDRRRFLLLASGALLSACNGATQTGRPEDALVQVYANPAKDEWPDQFRQLPAETQELYRFAASNHDVLQYIPCFCGCVNGVTHRTSTATCARRIPTAGFGSTRWPL